MSFLCTTDQGQLLIICFMINHYVMHASNYSRPALEGRLWDHACRANVGCHPKFDESA